MFEKKPIQLTLSLVLAVLILAGILYGLNRLKDLGRAPADGTDSTERAGDTEEQESMSSTQVILKTNKGDIDIELFDEESPETVANFVGLSKKGFYDGTKIHRVIPGFMIQGGDPLTKDSTNKKAWGTGGPGYTVADEFSEDLSNVRGTISMANTGQPNSGGSQFFINVADNTFLDFNKEPFTSKHAVFGRVVSGMDVVDAISALPTAERDTPLEDVVVMSVLVQG